MKKREASFQTLFNKYLAKSDLQGYFELKQTGGNTYLFSSMPQHQFDSLWAAHETGLIYKLSDEDSREKPFDCIKMPGRLGGLPAFVAIYFRKFRTAVVINFDDYFREARTSGKKSMTLERASSLAKKTILL